MFVKCQRGLGWTRAEDSMIRPCRQFSGNPRVADDNETLQLPLSPALVEELVAARRCQDPPAVLTEREREVLCVLAVLTYVDGRLQSSMPLVSPVTTVSPRISRMARADRRDLDRNAAAGASVIRSSRSSLA